MPDSPGISDTPTPPSPIPPGLIVEAFSKAKPFRPRRWFVRIKGRNGEIIFPGEAYNSASARDHAIDLLEANGLRFTLIRHDGRGPSGPAAHRVNW